MKTKVLLLASVATLTLVMLVAGCTRTTKTSKKAADGSADTAAEFAIEAGKAAQGQSKVKLAQCFECHDTVGTLHKSGTHKDVNCISCHTELAAHLADSADRPGTDTSWQSCGQCHAQQMDTMLQVSYHRPARDEKSQPTNRIPVWYDKLMAPHGFTKEHALTRPHALMLIDQYVVDRAFGGRFQPKHGWEYVLETGRVWDILEDTHPEEPGQKSFLPQTATANNPVCINCKTADHILDWAYMGDPDVGAKWSRTSNSVQMAKSTNYGINCFFCHDPHAAKPRIIRDALIEALSDETADNVYTRDANRTKIEVITMGERGYERKIALLDKPDSRLMCAQCHVEYNCNPGTNAETGEPVGFNSRLTNHYPLKNALELYTHYYEDIKFVDFKNKFDGAPLWKGQHPEFETYYESTHSKLGVGCADCHTQMSVKGEGGKFTDHFAQSPRHIAKAACLKSGCHSQWTEEQAIYTMDSVKAYTKGRMRKAEFWLSTLIDKINEANRANVSPEVLEAARKAHSQAHILWEYWTAENSDGFHNPALARQSLTQSITISTNAIDALDNAMK
ncbi:ammonia-forming cytochrome c nitrite reductase subunit c552 [Deferribacterales bacterium RsTz2092]|nr:cytochrome c-552 [Deferribacterales bacterium]GHU85855.1 cytochrome c-552 [Deferribacterales bacterium]